MMLQLDGFRLTPRCRRRLLIWLGFGFVTLFSVLLGLLIPQSPVTIEIWTGAGAAWNGW